MRILISPPLSFSSYLDVPNFHDQILNYHDFFDDDDDDHDAQIYHSRPIFPRGDWIDSCVEAERNLQLEQKGHWQ